MAKPRLLLADDHELLLDGLKKLLEPEFEAVAAVCNGRDAVSAFDRLRPDLLLLDIGLPGLNGIETARQVMSIAPAARILFVTMQTDRIYVDDAFRAGAAGYVLKQSAGSELVEAIRTVLNGQHYVSPAIAAKLGHIPFEKKPVELFGGPLTSRQREVLQLVAEGKAMKEIAQILGISIRTVEFHKNRIREELGVRTTAELTRYAMHHGLAWH